MKKYIVILAFIISTSTQLLVAQVPDWMVGTWKGFGHQPNALTQTEWSMTITIKSTDGKISVDYPSLKCGGSWLLEKTEGCSYIFKEHLTYGKSKCLDGGKCILSKVDENYIHVAFFNDYADVTKITSSSLLRKEIK